MSSLANDNPEQPVREQLRKTTIATTGVQPQTSTVSSDAPATSQPAVPRKKRSFEELDQADAVGEDHGLQKQHTRKRSRDSTTDGDDLRTEFKRTSHEGQRDLINAELSSNGDSIAAARSATPEAASLAVDMTSPKSKKSRLQEGDAPLTEDKAATNGADEPPIAAKDPPQTSSSAFAASAFGALSSSSTSGFGALGKNSGGFGAGRGFASPAKAISKQPEISSSDSAAKSSATTSTFGGALGARSAFASAGSNDKATFGSSFGKSSGFGSGSGFGSLAGSAPLTSFASKNGIPTFGSQKAGKSFGAPPDEEKEAEDDDDNDGDDSGVKSPLSVGTEEDQKDTRFYEQKVETGEEDEEAVYVSRAKLYNYAAYEGKKEWRERGFGGLKLNVSKLATDDDQDGSQQVTARLLIRADGSHRVVLNSPILKSIKVGGIHGGPPTNGQLCFMGQIDGKPDLEMLQLKMKAQSAIELYDKIIEVQEQM